MQIETITKLLALPNFKVVKVLEHHENSLHLYVDLADPWILSVPHAAVFIVDPFIAPAGSVLKISLFAAKEPFSIFPSARFAARVTVKSGSSSLTSYGVVSPVASLNKFTV